MNRLPALGSIYVCWKDGIRKIGVHIGNGLFADNLYSNGYVPDKCEPVKKGFDTTTII